MPVGANTKALLDKITDPDKKAKLEAALAEVDDISTELENGFLRHQDYTKKTQELSAHRKEIDDDWNTANAEYQRMLKENQDMQSSLTSTQAEKDEAAAKLAEAQKKLSETPTIDPSKFITPEQHQADMQKIAVGFNQYTGQVLKVISRHRKLFGEELDPEELMKGSAVAGKAPADYWSETYKVPEKEKELADAAQAKLLADAKQEGYKQALAEAANPATRTLKQSETPFYTPKDEKTESPWDSSTMTPTDTKFLEELQRVTS